MHFWFLVLRFLSYLLKDLGLEMEDLEDSGEESSDEDFLEGDEVWVDLDAAPDMEVVDIQILIDLRMEMKHLNQN